MELGILVPSLAEDDHIVFCAEMSLCVASGRWRSTPLIDRLELYRRQGSRRVCLRRRNGSSLGGILYKLFGCYRQHEVSVGCRKGGQREEYR